MKLMSGGDIALNSPTFDMIISTSQLIQRFAQLHHLHQKERRQFDLAAHPTVDTGRYVPARRADWHLYASFSAVACSRRALCHLMRMTVGMKTRCGGEVNELTRQGQF